MNMIIQPKGGLANRMRAIDSALHLVGSEKKLSVWWVKEIGLLNADFSSVFQSQDFIKEKKLSKNLLKFFSYYDSKDKRLIFLLQVLEALHLFLFLDEYSCLNKAKISRANKYLFCFIRTWEAFYAQSEFHSSIFKLKDKLKLEKELSKIDSNTIGVHIRRTDNVNAIENSPLALFEQRMLVEIQTNPEINFYLCTDDIETKNFFKSDFWKSKVKMPDGPVNRYSEAGIIQAACEMHALSKTKKIIGSYWSSFGEIAARLGNIEIEILHIHNHNSMSFS